MSNSKKYRISVIACLALAAAFLVVFFTSLLSCSGGAAQSTPKEALEEFVLAVNEGRYDEAQSVISSGSAVIFGEAEEGTAQRAVFDAVYACFDIELEKQIILGGNAVADVNVSFFDLRSFAADVYEIVQQRAYDLSYDGKSISSEEEANELVSAVELELLDGDISKYISSESVKLKLTVEDGNWRIVADDSFYLLLSGYAGQIEIENEVEAEDE